ncbi:cyanophycinase [Sphingobacterium puteale]|uniref:Cyanophycinase n=1 Tax=Sphingobacterium puteale TaxID=2420510 RepID=A0A420VYD3_9SPHI|nr:cyanophycinase [Sphingobacterium puteale]RKO71354.1 cyanophycinase [Sphingobacterium puteale]
MKKLLCIIVVVVLCSFTSQKSKIPPKGTLFVIGGGHKDEHLMEALVQAAQLSSKDYIMILPMASTLPEESVEDMVKQLKEVTKNKVTSINFSKSDAENKRLVDSVRNAKLIYITGGDQNRFMSIVANTALFDAIHAAYQQGACIAGTSAGAAIMSETMITGNQLKDTVYRPTFNRLEHQNLETAKGLGLIKTAIIDQHFVKRSRYNRLFTALAEFPDKTCIGIDEGTAIIVRQNTVKVVGESLVIVAKNPRGLKKKSNGMITWDNLTLSAYDEGAMFKLK